MTNSLATRYPVIAAQLHPDLNGGVSADRIVAGSQKKYWWVCDKGPDHVWEAPSGARTRGSGCPSCSGHKVSVTNSLASLHPNVAAQLHPDLNGGVTADQIVAGSTTRYWWVCDKGPDHVWDATADKRTRGGRGCPFCAGHKVSVTNSLETLYPDVAAQLHPDLNGGVTADQIVVGSEKKYWWVCDQGDDHVWEAAMRSRSGGGLGCPCCSGQKVSTTNSLETLYPDVAAQLHPDLNGGASADQIVAGSHAKYWWVCDQGDDHVWEAPATNRTRLKSGCPCCNGKRVSITNSLAELHPELAAQLHPDLNGGVTADQIVAGSHAKYWWVCDRGDDHVWEAAVSSRTHQGSGCPCCNGKKVSITNSLAELHPEIAAQLHPELNGGVTAEQVVGGSNSKYWWICDQGAGHVWEAAVASRTRLKSGCPFCSVAGRSKFELQIARLIEAHTGLHVDVDVKVTIPGHARRLQVDLEIPELGFLIDLDPPFWHQDAERDQRKLHLLAIEDDRTYIRVRGAGTPRIRGNVVEAAYCPEAFANALRPFLEAFVPWRDLDPSEIAAALAAADSEWSELLAPANEQFAKAA